MIIGTSVGAHAYVPGTACTACTACTAAELFLDGLFISGPGLYRVDESSATSAGPGQASISSLAEVGL
ncbi:hypothetical protein [Streptomyces sp. NPDC051677]|uniref:hypothetical protein n=1 Tax=Streptomyces sp. NPDC051677 TaxID=3365669 RepID=UPI0037CD7129